MCETFSGILFRNDDWRWAPEYTDHHSVMIRAWQLKEAAGSASGFVPPGAVADQTKWVKFEFTPKGYKTNAVEWDNVDGYAQMLGRGTRPLAGTVDGIDSRPDRIRRIVQSAKPSVMVLDFVGNSGAHKLITPADILGGQLDDRTLERAKQIAKERGGSVQAAIDEAKKKIKEEDELAKQRAARKRAEAKARAQYSTADVSPFDPTDLSPRRNFEPTGNRPATDKQIARLASWGIDARGMSVTEASRHIGNKIQSFKSRRATA